jgi:tRNA(Ile)-lysidine synthase
MNSDREKHEPRRACAKSKLSCFAQHLLAEWKHLSLPLDDGRIIVAISGGADSTALLLALDELVGAERLKLKLIVAHLDHGLRGASGARDAEWVAQLAGELDYECVLGHAAVEERRLASRDNLEQAARRARYQFLLETAKRTESRLVLTAHTMDDQAETILLRLMRGSGVDGLKGIEPVRPLAKDEEILLVRPLVEWAGRAETEGYCRACGVGFRVDEMNADERFARVRVRKTLLPLMRTFNPRIVEALTRTVARLREDSSALEAAATRLLAAASAHTEGEGASVKDQALKPAMQSLRVTVLAQAPAAVRRRALRQWLAHGRGDLRRLESVHLLAVDRLLFGATGGRVALLPGGAAVERRRGFLHLRLKCQ